MTDVSNKVALAIGSAPRISKAIAGRFGRLGGRVVVNHSAKKASAGGRHN